MVFGIANVPKKRSSELKLEYIPLTSMASVRHAPRGRGDVAPLRRLFRSRRQQ